MSMQDYGTQWREYRRLRNRFILMFAGWMPAGIFVAYLSDKLFRTFKPAFAWAFLWMGTLLYLHLRLQWWRCPRCGKEFMNKPWAFAGLPWFLVPCCIHCGLAKHAKKAEE